MKKIIAIMLILLVGLFVLAGYSHVKSNIKSIDTSVENGREFLSKANYGKASEVAQANLDTDEGKHLQGDVYFLNGRYQEAVDIYGKISSNYDEKQKVLQNMASIYLYHLKDIKKAQAITVKLENETAVSIYADALSEPMEVVSKGTFEVPMLIDDPLNPYIPRVKGSINGQEQILTFDTGGNYLIMTAKTAKELGIEYDVTKSFEGQQGEGRSEIWVGVADSVQLGEELTLRNVPVGILSEMNVELIVFGTNILKEFVSTIDYPNDKFVFTTKDDKSLVQKHLDQYQGNKMDFAMWDDHYMMGKGKYNGQNVNMFFDSGLVVVGVVDEQPAQAWLTINKENMELLGIKEKDSVKSMEVTQTKDTVEFAGHVNENALITLSALDFKFNDVKCDFLISHGIIKEYAWTIDFENMEYMFKE